MAQNWISSVGFVLTLVAGALFLLAAIHDTIARTVPNGLALTLALVGLGIRLANGNLIPGLIAGFAVFAVAAFCWRRGWMGGGDVKLLGAGAIAVPPHLVMTFIMVMGIAGAILALIYLLGRSLPAPRPTQRPTSLLSRAFRVERWRFSRGGPLPYACAIAAGGLFVLL